MALPEWCLLSKSGSRPLFRRKQQLKMAEQLLLKVCSITFYCCFTYFQCSMNDRGPFHDQNIQASFADKFSLKAARSIGQPQTYIARELYYCSFCCWQHIFRQIFRTMTPEGTRERICYSRLLVPHMSASSQI